MRLAGTAALCVLQSVKTTLENALRSGERMVLEDLKESQQQTVALMRQNDRKARWVRVLGAIAVPCADVVAPVQGTGAAVLQVKAGPCRVPAREAQVSCVQGPDVRRYGL